MRDIIHFTTYYPKHSGLFNDQSQMLLDFKNSKPYAVAYYEQCLTDWCMGNIHSSVCITAIPSSQAGKVNQITKTCTAVASRISMVEDGTAYLTKRNSHTSFCRSGKRDAFMLSRSLSVSHAVAGKHILLVDDVTTTGISMYVTERLLLDAGALSVTCLACAFTPLITHRSL